MIPRLVIASKNPDKIDEIGQVLTTTGLVDEIVTGLDWPDVAETGSTLEENALLKARAVVQATGLPVIADDTGLEVAALGGAPGVHTARFAGEAASYEDNVTKMLEVLPGNGDRSARFRTVVVLALPDGVEVVADGSLEGVIAGERRGSNGFGYDPVFEVDGRTLAEMTIEEKNQLSHRARAVRALAESVLP
ncbi:MAG TPA: RdgB/HAM1 family non-canonical purine NTP pyrophosphatase [Acidimicrobiia bacterium]